MSPMLAKWGSGPSGPDADGWRKILTSCSFGAASSELQKTLTMFVKRLCVEEIRNGKSQESFIWKSSNDSIEKSCLSSCKILQLCGRQVAGS